MSIKNYWTDLFEIFIESVKVYELYFWESKDRNKL